MKSGLSALLLCALAFSTSFLHAQTPAPAAPINPDVDELLRVAHIQEIVEKMNTDLQKQLGDGLRINLESKQVPPNVVEKAVKAQEEAFSQLKGDLAWEKVKSLYAQAYSDTFTKEEVKGLIEFYQTPLGQSFAVKQPVANQKGLDALRSTVNTLIPKIKQSIGLAIMQAMKAGGSPGLPGLPPAGGAHTGLPGLSPAPAK